MVKKNPFLKKTGEKVEINPFASLYNLKFETLLKTAKPQFVNAKVLINAKSKRTYLNAIISNEFPKSVSKIYFKYVFFSVVFEKLRKAT